MATDDVVASVIDDLCEDVETTALCYTLPSNAFAIAWDTETTGLNGVIVQLGIVVVDIDGNELLTHSRLFAPIPDYPSESRAYAVHHISEAMQQKSGEPVIKSLLAFTSLAREARKRGITLVAHNAAFDCRILKNTARALGGDAVDMESECTMILGKRVSNAKHGTNRRPSNEALYNMLIGKVPDTVCLHDAVGDARLTAQSYVRGHKLGFW